MTALNFRPHHVALTVRNTSASRSFYNVLGFDLVAEWTAKDHSLVISHLRCGSGLVLELFCYAEERDQPSRERGVGNDLTVVGVKHIGFDVDNLIEVRNQFMADGHTSATEIVMGRTQVEYFFLQDPDGTWVEVVNDKRVLSKSAPLILTEL